MKRNLIVLLLLMTAPLLCLVACSGGNVPAESAEGTESTESGGTQESETPAES